MALLSFLNAHCPGILCFDFTELAEEAGTYRAANVAMLGAAAGTGVLPFSEEILQAVLDTEIPEKYRAVNRAAFEGAMKRFQVSLNLSLSSTHTYLNYLSLTDLVSIVYANLRHLNREQKVK